MEDNEKIMLETKQRQMFVSMGRAVLFAMANGENKDYYLQFAEYMWTYVNEHGVALAGELIDEAAKHNALRLASVLHDAEDKHIYDALQILKKQYS